ncbi:MAG: septum formation inhibitor Maf [Ruminococcaceae bacterium]|jgi:septum formation protein|nr:septum formation inhibitor Maf [Oscillospiraceae bacterium]
MNNTKHIVLASGSPRRQELLRRIGITDFDVVVPHADETCPAGLTAQQTVAHIAEKKAEAAKALTAPEDIVITADTMVFLGDERLGKPRDEADALRMLSELAGNKHTVCTGVTVRQGEKQKCFTVSTDVYFRAASESELRAYIASGEPMDKAGAYGIQGLGSLLVERIDGDFFNVMGLPVLALSLALRDFGIDLL